MQNGATGGQLDLHRWGATETHSDGNHRHPCRKSEAANTAQQAVRKRDTSRESREPEYAQRVIKAGLIHAAAFQPLHQAEQ